MTDNDMTERSSSKTGESTVRKKKISADDIAKLSKMFRPFDVDRKLIHPFKQMKQRPKFPRY